MAFQATVNMRGVVTDDGLPIGGTLTSLWSQDSGPTGGVTFTDPSDPQTSALVTQPGTYVLKLTANDGEKSSEDTMTLTATLPENQPPNVEAGDDQQVVLVRT